MKIVIIGGSPSYILAPFDPDSEIWVHGNQFDRFQEKRVTRIFEIHDDLSEHDESYPQWLVDQGIPLVVGEGFPIKGDYIRTFPFDEVYDLPLTSTPAYMMALAILEGADEISLYGIDMAVDDHEYFYQRPSMYAWIGYAKGLGIDVTIEGPLLKDTHIEGKGSGGKPDFAKPPFTEKAFLDIAQIHQQKINDYQSRINQLQALIQTHDGSRQSYERLAKVARAVESGQDITLIDSMVIK